MKRRIFPIAFCLALAAIATASLNTFAVSLRELNHQQDEDKQEGRGFSLPKGPKGKIVVANRTSGTISVINVVSDRVVGTYALPAGAKTPEPMYVVYSRDRVFVGDRANNRIAVFNPRTFAVETTVPAGAGIWHMWADPFDRQLWVNNDIDKTSTVIDPLTLQVLATVPIPADLAAVGGKPHDVILDPSGAPFAYVTLIGVAGANDYVVKFSTQTFAEVARAAVGKDPHVSATSQNNLLYVPCQNSNALVVLNRATLEHVTTLSIPGAHGAGMATNGDVFYTTNLTGGGRDALWRVSAATNTVSGDAVDAPFAVPHNIALTPDRGVFFPQEYGNRKLYLTHSGATASQVTVYKLKNGLPAFHKTITVGFNPFGLTFVP